MYSIKNYGILKNIKHIQINQVHHYDIRSDHYVCKIENNFETTHSLIPKSKKLLILKSFEQLLHDNSREMEQIPSLHYWQRYDEQGKAECDLLFDYDDIKQCKHTQIARLVKFFQEKNLITKTTEVDISKIIEYADSFPLNLVNHKKW